MPAANMCASYENLPVTGRDYDCRIFAATGIPLDEQRQKSRAASASGYSTTKAKRAVGTRACCGRRLASFDSEKVFSRREVYRSILVPWRQSASVSGPSLRNSPRVPRPTRWWFAPARRPRAVIPTGAPRISPRPAIQMSRSLRAAPERTSRRQFRGPRGGLRQIPSRPADH